MQYRNYKNALTILQECNNATTRIQYRNYKDVLPLLQECKKTQLEECNNVSAIRPNE